MLKTSTHHSRNGRSPFICVKLHDMHREVPAETLKAATDNEQELAWERTADEWWREAAAIAQKHGFNDVQSAGRSGGWLGTVPLPEPTEDEETGDEIAAKYPAEFLEEIETHLKGAPGIFARHLGEIVGERLEDEAQAAADAKDKARAAESLCLPLQLSQLSTDTPDAPGSELLAVVSDARGLPVFSMALRGTAESDNRRARAIVDAVNAFYGVTP